MELAVVGLNHKTAPVEVRECLAPEDQDLEALLRQALGLPKVREALVVSTCNRVEVVVCSDPGQDPVPVVKRWLAGGKALPPQKVLESLYAYSGEEAVRHLFRVASSLDSMVVGEPQILGQMKEAYRASAAAGTSRTVLNKLMHKTFHVAKKVRSETNIGGAAVSVSYAAVLLAKKIFDQLEGLKALLVGAGEMAELAAEHLLANGVASVAVANRTLTRSVELSRRLGGGGRAYELEDLPEILSESDIVISSTGSPDAVITKQIAKQAQKKRRGLPIFFIDIAVPRDVEPRVSSVEGCFVYDIDDLASVVEEGKAARQKEAREAERLVAAEVIKFKEWFNSLEVQPTIAELAGKAEKIRQTELARTMKQLGELSPGQSQALDALTKSLVKKIIHDPIIFIKANGHKRSQSTRKDHLALVRRIFRLGQIGEE